MFTNIQYGSAKSNTMDVCNVQRDCAWVIDGSDPLFPTHISDASSDGEWLVKELNLYLKQHLLESDHPIGDTVARGLRSIHKQYLQFPGADKLYDLEMPSACCAIIRVRNGWLSYFVMGNCELLLQDHEGKTQSICDLRLQELDARLFEISQDLRQTQRMPLIRAQDFVDNLMVENRLRRNMKGGYWVLGEEASVVSQAIIGSVPIQQISHISLICNGFAQYFNCRKVVRQLERYLTSKRTMEFVDFYNSLLVKKHKNEKLARYLQETLSGQSTAVFFDVLDARKLDSPVS